MGAASDHTCRQSQHRYHATSPVGAGVRNDIRL